MDNSTILMVVALPLGYAILLVGSALLAGPLRRDLAIIAEDMIRDSKTRDADRNYLNFLLDSCMSFKVGAVLPLALLSTMIDDLLKRPREESKLLEDQRYHAIIWRYFVSVLAANPLVSLITIPLAIIAFCLFLLRGEDGVRGAVEDPAFRASFVASPKVCGV